MTLRIGLLLFVVFVLVSTQAASAEARLGEPACSCCSMLGVPEIEGKHANKVRWTSDGSQILFEQDMAVYLAAADGSRLQEVANGDYWGVGMRYRPSYPTLSLDVSPSNDRIVYATCRHPHRVTHSSPLSEWTSERTQFEIVTANIDGTNPQRLTENRALDYFPVWSPNGARIAFISGPSIFDYPWAHQRLYTMAADGSYVVDISFWGGLHVELYPPAWSPDGRHIAFVAEEGEGDSFRTPVYTVSLDELEFTRISDARSGASWSPDGSRLAFAKSVDGGVGVYTAAADGTDVRLVTVMEEGSGSWWPVWSPSGSEILVSCVTVCVVDAEDGSLVGRSPINLHAGNVAAWSPDGSRIAVMSGEYSYRRNGSIALYTMARDGTDLQVLVRGGRSLVAENSGWQDADVGVASCSAGFVIAEPETNPGLVRDCEILMRARGVLVGMNPWRPYRSDLSGGSPESTWGDVVMNWGPGTPIDQWTGVRIEDVCVPPSRLGTDGCRLAHPLVEPILGPPTHYASIAPVWRFRQLFTLPEGRVTGLQLGGGSPSYNTNFTGTIPHELGDLVYLRSLDLSGYAGGSSRSPAALSGGIPPELGRLQLLRELDLGHNQLTGSIPNELGRLVSLRTLNLRRNRLGGSIPQELDGLTELSTLRLDNNQLTGSIPPELGRLTKLRRLWLTENQLTGSIPPELGRLTKLQGLWLSENQLTGKAPSELGGITPLARLNLSGNRFECLPAELVYKHDLEIDARGLETCLASSYAFQVSELAAVGHLVGAVFATDADAVSYSITAGNEDGRFAIDADSGEITVAGPLDAEAVSSYDLDLQGIGETGEAVAASVLITVISRLEPCSRGIAVPDPGDNADLVSDCALLLEARDTLDRSRYSSAPYNLNWSAATPMADWRGVRVGGSPRRVQTLDLNIGNWDEIRGDVIPPPLSGELAPELGGLTGLWGLDLRYSNIGGELPLEWENLSGLKVLYLNTRRLTGCIPASLRDVERTNLRQVELPNCDEE